MATREEIIQAYRSRIKAESRTKLQRQELETLINGFIGQLAGLSSEQEIKRLCEAEIALLEEGYPQATIQGNQMPQYRNAISEAILKGELTLKPENSHMATVVKDSGEEFTVQNHFALTYFKYDNEIYQRIRNQGTEANNKRQDNLQPINPERYLEAVQELIEKSDELSLAIAITAVTGRRFTEVAVKGEFKEAQHSYLLSFTGQQKKKAAIAPAYEILTLIPASQVLSVINKFRTTPAIVALEGKAYDSPEMNTFNTRLNREVQRVFGDSGIIPTIEGRRNVSLHRLRGVYGALLIHFWCPNNLNQHRFLQRYLGHVIEGEASAPNSLATPHYFHYYVVDENGKSKTAQGIKVPANGMIPLEEVQPASEIKTQLEPEEAKAPATSKKRASLRIASQDQNRWHSILENMGGSLTQEGKMSKILEIVEQHLDQTQAVSSTPSIQAISNQAAALAWMTQQLLELETKLQDSQEEHRRTAEKLRAMQTTQPDTRELEDENTVLRELLSQAEAKLNQFRSLLTGNSEPPAPQPAPVPKTLAPLSQSAPVAAPALTPQSASAPKTKPDNAPRERKAFNRAKVIFEALQDWNVQHPQETFALTTGILEQTFGINRKAAKEFLDEFGEQISDHHAAIGVKNDRTHNRGKNLDVLRDYVGAYLTTQEAN
jgi:hypothetical protein